MKVLPAIASIQVDIIDLILRELLEAFRSGARICKLINYIRASGLRSLSMVLALHNSSSAMECNRVLFCCHCYLTCL